MKKISIKHEQSSGDGILTFLYHALKLVSLLVIYFLVFLSLFGGWKNGRIENWEMIEKWKDKKDFNFNFNSLMVFDWGVEKWKYKKLFCLIVKKKERIENIIGRNLLYEGEKPSVNDINVCVYSSKKCMCISAWVCIHTHIIINFILYSKRIPPPPPSAKS